MFLRRLTSEREPGEEKDVGCGYREREREPIVRRQLKENRNNRDSIKGLVSHLEKFGQHLRRHSLSQSYKHKFIPESKCPLNI